jgi:hypothetical protein
MKTGLVDYLVDMELDAFKATEFRKNPEGAMAEAGLSKKHRLILQSRNPNKIQRAVFKEKPFEAPLCRPNRLFNTIM